MLLFSGSAFLFHWKMKTDIPEQLKYEKQYNFRNGDVNEKFTFLEMHMENKAENDSYVTMSSLKETLGYITVSPYRNVWVDPLTNENVNVDTAKMKWNFATNGHDVELHTETNVKIMRHSVKGIEELHPNTAVLRKCYSAPDSTLKNENKIVPRKRALCIESKGRRFAKNDGC